MDEYENLFETAEYALRQSWEIHRQAFGPILEPAFAETPQVRIKLISALNHISRREIERGMEILKEIGQYCIYDEDRAAWAFCVGLCFEMAGAQKQMLQWYAEAGKYNHRFYLPYLKQAKAAHSEGRLSDAKGHYETAIACLLEAPEKDRDEIILGSAYTNFASCLTMMHRYKDAEAAWEQARRYPAQPGAAATAAVLYAAMGETEKSAAYLEELKRTCPEMVAQIREVTRQILSGTHPDFAGG